MNRLTLMWSECVRMLNVAFSGVQDKQADLIIHAYIDDIMVAVMKSLNISIPQYDTTSPPQGLS